MKKLLAIAALIASVAVPGVNAQSASTTFSVVINSPPSTSVTLTAVAPCTLSGSTLTCTGPMAANATLATIAVAPAGWSGTLTLSAFTGGATASSFAVAGTNLVAGSGGLATSFNGGATLTASP